MDNQILTIITNHSNKNMHNYKNNANSLKVSF